MRLLALLCLVLPGLAAQTFAPPQALDLDLPRVGQLRDGALWVGDLDGDGKPDLLVTAQGNEGMLSGTRIHALSSRGAEPPHVLGSPVILRVDGQPLSTTEGVNARLTPRCCDLDGDGILDLVAAAQPVSLRVDASGIPAGPVISRFERKPVRWFRGRADGGFAAAEAVLSVEGRHLFVPANVERDAHTVVVDAGGAAGFADLVAFGRAGEPIEVVPADCNGDGRVDIVVQTANNLLLHLGTAQGFGEGVAISDDEGPLLVTDESTPWFVDLDGDAVVDLVSVLPNQSIGLRRGKRVGEGIRFRPPITLVARPDDDRTRSLAIADWDGDGRLDLLLSENSLQTIEGRPLTAAEQAKLAKATAALRPLELEYAALLGPPARLNASTLRARRNEREALEARMQPHRILVETLERLERTREERRLRVLFLRGRA